ncbi:MAG: hypothetical protein ABI967_01800 [bacterium]
MDLHEALKVDKILLTDPVCTPRSLTAAADTTALKFVRDSGAVFVDFPEVLKAGRVYTIDFYYSWNPLETGRFRSDWSCYRIPHFSSRAALKRRMIKYQS